MDPKEKPEENQHGETGIPASPGEKEKREIENPPQLDPGENPGPGEGTKVQ